MSQHLENWMDAYVVAWDSNEPTDIARLFTPDAVYDPQVAGGPWDGVEAIVDRWVEIGDTPGNWEFEWAAVVETDDLAVVEARTSYLDPPASYRNLFILRFADDGRCRDFTEWWIDEDLSD